MLYQRREYEECAMGQSDQKVATFDQLWRDQSWQQITNCPGRYRLTGRESNLGPVELIGEMTDVREYDLSICPDAVLVAELKDGGLISYRRSNETYVHTLNTPEGFVRKLKQLGIG